MHFLVATLPIVQCCAILSGNIYLALLGLVPLVNNRALLWLGLGLGLGLGLVIADKQ